MIAASDRVRGRGKENSDFTAESLLDRGVSRGGTVRDDKFNLSDRTPVICVTSFGAPCPVSDEIGRLYFRFFGRVLRVITLRGTGRL